MKQYDFELLLNEWRQMTATVLDLNEIPCNKLQLVLKESYKVLSAFQSDSLVPKEIAQLFLEMEEFLYFASVMEDNEKGTDYYNFRKLFLIIRAFKKGFFEGKYECDFPKLQLIGDNKNTFVFDFENGCLCSDISY